MNVSSPPAGDLDRLDIAILEILQNNNGTPQRRIGEAVGLSAPAVQRRIKRMEETGVIRANVAIVDPARVGQPLIIVVTVQLENERADLIDEAKRAFVAAQEVQQCYYITGEADFLLIVVVPTMGEYEALTRRLFFKNANIKKFHTLVVMDCVKVSMRVPLPT